MSGRHRRTGKRRREPAVPRISLILLVGAVFVLLTVAPTGRELELARALPAGQQRGMVLPTWEPHGYDTPEMPALLGQIADVGAGWVQLVPTWYQATATATQIESVGKGPDDQGVRDAIALAHRQGLRVLLKPHLDVLDGTDRSKIAPSNTRAWFASYTAFITHYAELAADLRVDEFAAGTELASMDQDRAAWEGVIRAVRERYTGPIVYAATYTGYAKVAFWDLVDVVGIDAYWPLSAEPTSDVAALKRVLAPIRAQLAAFAGRVHHRILFTEAGYTSQRGTTTSPGDWLISTQPAQDEQAAAYQAVLETFADQAWWAGVFWWVWIDIPADLGQPPQALDYSVRGKAAESVVRQWWAASPPTAEQ